jgi:hypothetical protein
MLGRCLAGRIGTPSMTTLPQGTWHDPDLGRPIAAPLEQCAELLGVDLATVRELAAGIEPYVRADGATIVDVRVRVEQPAPPLPLSARRQ